MNIARTEKTNPKAKSTDQSTAFMLDVTLQSSLSSVLLSARGNPHSLLVKTVLEKLNHQFGYELEEPKEKNASEKNQSAEAFATDLAIMMSDFLTKFSQDKKGQDSQHCANEFLVQGLHAVNDAFSETKEILSAFGALPSGFSASMEEIYDLLIKKMDLVLEGSKLRTPVS